MVIVAAALAGTSCSALGGYDGPGYAGSYGYGPPPPYYGPPAYYGAPVYGYGYEGREREHWHGAGDGYDGAQRQQALTAQQQLYNQRITGAEQRYNQQLSTNPAAAAQLREQLAREGSAARSKLEQDTRGLR
jgi:hypothetical protein